jgi:hypothetical protein
MMAISKTSICWIRKPLPVIKYRWLIVLVYSEACQNRTPLRPTFVFRRHRLYLIQHYVIKFVSDLRQVGGFLRILRFPPPVKVGMGFECSFIETYNVKYNSSKHSSSCEDYQLGSFLYTALCDKVCQWLTTGRWFSLYNIMW